MRAWCEWIDAVGWVGDVVVLGMFLAIAAVLASLEKGGEHGD